MHHINSLGGMLQERAIVNAGQPAYTFHDYSLSQSYSLTFAQLDARARRIASYLTEHGMQGRNILLVFHAGLDFIEAFFGCLYAGAVPVPLSAPLTTADKRRLTAVARDARSTFVLSAAGLVSAVNHVLQSDGLSYVQVIDLAGLDNVEWDRSGFSVKHNELALIQYTSGSTGVAKGVMLTHENILTNQRAIQQAFEHDERAVVVGWLPMFHDMGLIGNVLQPLFLGAHSIVFSPLAFVQNPLRWLQLISDYRATTSGGPNFAYAMCTRRIDTADRSGIDLSSWSLAFTGAETIRKPTLEGFCEKFSRWGFNKKAFYSCYGLAEATLFVTGSTKLSDVNSLYIDGRKLREHSVVPVDPGSAHGIEVSSCGYPRCGHKVNIVNPETSVLCEERQVGEVWLSSDSNAKGYWPGATDACQAFQSKIASLPEYYLRTGDLGFIERGELYITGRIKDLIIVRGKNRYPQDIEHTVESHPDIRHDSCAALGIEVAGEERLVVLIELRPRSADQLSILAADVRELITRQHGIGPDDIVFVKPNRLFRTSSGKLQRFKCRELYLTPSPSKTDLDH